MIPVMNEAGLHYLNGRLLFTNSKGEILFEMSGRATVDETVSCAWLNGIVTETYVRKKLLEFGRKPESLMKGRT